MGQFSWIASDVKTPVLDNVKDDVYLLIPKEFGGGYYHTDYYDGYGNIGVDVYEAVVDWNKKYLSEALIEPKPKLEQFGVLYDFRKDELRGEGKSEEEISEIELAQKQEFLAKALDRRQKLLESMMDFKNDVSDDAMVEKYGCDWKREIGIAIACHDKQNASLPYPIKIVHNSNISYEQALPSMGDPGQGWGFEYDIDSELTEEEQEEEYLQDVAFKFDSFIDSYYTKYKAIGDALRNS